MRGRIKEDDSSVPAPDGPFAYFWKFREGGQHELIGRTPRDGGDVQILLDGDALAAGHDYFQFGGTRHSPDHRLEAWSADVEGSEYFTIRVRAGTTARPRRPRRGDRRQRRLGPRLRRFFYVQLDDNHRPLKVYRHRLGTQQADDVLVYEEKDPAGSRTSHESSSGRFCVIASGDHETSERG